MLSATAPEVPSPSGAGLPPGVTVASLLHAGLTGLPHHLAKVQVLELAPRVVAPSHADTADEFLYLLSGKGVVEIDGRSTAPTHQSVVSVPKGRRKVLRNVSHSAELRVLAFLVARRDPNIFLLVP